MDKELVEKITRLVLERMSFIENPTNGTLSDDEIKEWNSFHVGGNVNQTFKGNTQYLVPLSDSEVTDWSNFTLMNSVSGSVFENGNNTHSHSNKVKFSRY